MDRDGLYATVVIPPGFTGSLLNVAGQHVPSAAARTAPRITLLTNQRAGTEGVSLATGILQPALAVASRQIGQHLTPLVPPSARTGATKVLLTDPVTVTTTQYRPVPQNSALGLSAFYIALLTILSGFIGGVIVNSVVDTTLGYAINELGPRYRQRPPVSIDRWRTLLIKWAIAFPLTGAITGVILLVAAGGLGMNAPYPGLLWVYTWLCALSVAAGLLLPPAPGNSRTAKLARASRPRRRPDGSCSGGAETLNAPLATLGPRLAKPAGPGCQFLVAPPTV